MPKNYIHKLAQVDARKYESNTTIAKEMVASARRKSQHPTVVTIDEGDSITTRRLKRIILSMVTYMASDRKNISDIAKELNGE